MSYIIVAFQPNANTINAVVASFAQAGDKDGTLACSIYLSSCLLSAFIPSFLPSLLARLLVFSAASISAFVCLNLYVFLYITCLQLLCASRPGAVLWLRRMVEEVSNLHSAVHVSKYIPGDSYTSSAM